MKHTIRQTNKGYVIEIKSKGIKYKYFLWDDTHTKEKYIAHILAHCEYVVGEPFNNIHPIYIKPNVIQRIDKENSPIGILIKQRKMSVIWSYYRRDITEYTSPKLIKQYANEFKSNLSLLGLDKLYEFVQAQA